MIAAKPLVMVMSWEVSDDEDEIGSEDELEYDEEAEQHLVEDDLDSDDGEELEELADNFEGRGEKEEAEVGRLAFSTLIHRR